MATDCEDDILEFAFFQSALVEEFSKKHPECKDKKFLLDFPRQGTLKAGGHSWTFLRHGAGIRFTMEKSPHLTVDVHDKFNDPRALDTWRLTSFLESKGKHVDPLLILKELQRMADAGLLMTIDGRSFSMIAG